MVPRLLLLMVQCHHRSILPMIAVENCADLTTGLGFVQCLTLLLVQARRTVTQLKHQ
jgi:hypothetical protein